MPFAGPPIVDAAELRQGPRPKTELLQHSFRVGFRSGGRGPQEILAVVSSLPGEGGVVRASFSSPLPGGAASPSCVWTSNISAHPSSRRRVAPTSVHVKPLAISSKLVISRKAPQVPFKDEVDSLTRTQVDHRPGIHTTATPTLLREGWLARGLGSTRMLGLRVAFLLLSPLPRSLALDRVRAVVTKMGLCELNRLVDHRRVEP
mmetsp:Transcript_29634/g.60841  ORF Transcript_29634/g.60841 Transcript_29634/m.60841 type:complete len:204 (+) Transcript_29634:1815-2426(+)